MEYSGGLSDGWSSPGTWSDGLRAIEEFDWSANPYGNESSPEPTKGDTASDGDTSMDIESPPTNTGNSQGQTVPTEDELEPTVVLDNAEAEDTPLRRGQVKETNVQEVMDVDVPSRESSPTLATTTPRSPIDTPGTSPHVIDFADASHPQVQEPSADKQDIHDEDVVAPTEGQLILPTEAGFQNDGNDALADIPLPIDRPEIGLIPRLSSPKQTLIDTSYSFILEPTEHNTDPSLPVTSWKTPAAPDHLKPSTLIDEHSIPTQAFYPERLYQTPPLEPFTVAGAPLHREPIQNDDNMGGMYKDKDASTDGEQVAAILVDLPVNDFTAPACEGSSNSGREVAVLEAIPAKGSRDELPQRTPSPPIEGSETASRTEIPNIMDRSGDLGLHCQLLSNPSGVVPIERAPTEYDPDRPHRDVSALGLNVTLEVGAESQTHHKPLDEHSSFISPDAVAASPNGTIPSHHPSKAPTQNFTIHGTEDNTMEGSPESGTAVLAGTIALESDATLVTSTAASSGKDTGELMGKEMAADRQEPEGQVTIELSTQHSAPAETPSESSVAAVPLTDVPNVASPPQEQYGVDDTPGTDPTSAQPIPRLASSDHGDEQTHTSTSPASPIGHEIDSDNTIVDASPEHRLQRPASPKRLHDDTAPINILSDCIDVVAQTIDVSSIQARAHASSKIGVLVNVEKDMQLRDPSLAPPVAPELAVTDAAALSPSLEGLDIPSLAMFQDLHIDKEDEQKAENISTDGPGSDPVPMEATEYTRRRHTGESKPLRFADYGDSQSASAGSMLPLSPKTNTSSAKQDVPEEDAPSMSSAASGLSKQSLFLNSPQWNQTSSPKQIASETEDQKGPLELPSQEVRSNILEHIDGNPDAFDPNKKDNTNHDHVMAKDELLPAFSGTQLTVEMHPARTSAITKQETDMKTTGQEDTLESEHGEEHSKLPPDTEPDPPPREQIATPTKLPRPHKVKACAKCKKAKRRCIHAEEAPPSTPNPPANAKRSRAKNSSNTKRKDGNFKPGRDSGSSSEEKPAKKKKKVGATGSRGSTATSRKNAKTKRISTDGADDSETEPGESEHFDINPGQEEEMDVDDAGHSGDAGDGEDHEEHNDQENQPPIVLSPAPVETPASVRNTRRASAVGVQAKATAVKSPKEAPAVAPKAELTKRTTRAEAAVAPVEPSSTASSGRSLTPTDFSKYDKRKTRSDKRAKAKMEAKAKALDTVKKTPAAKVTPGPEDTKQIIPEKRKADPQPHRTSARLATPADTDADGLSSSDHERDADVDKAVMKSGKPKGFNRDRDREASPPRKIMTRRKSEEVEFETNIAKRLRNTEGVKGKVRNSLAKEKHQGH